MNIGKKPNNEYISPNILQGTKSQWTHNEMFHKDYKKDQKTISVFFFN